MVLAHDHGLLARTPLKTCPNHQTATVRCIHHVAGECELIDHRFKDGRVSPFSLPRCRNVYVLPGVPDLLRQKWRTLKVLSCRVSCRGVC